MSVRSAYDTWSSQYDTNANRTRDLEGKVLQEVLAEVRFTRVLEIGCGTGKNTQWLALRAAHVTAVDLSDGMLALAREKVRSPGVRFAQADVLAPWTFRDGSYDLVTFSLVLEHIEDLGPMLRNAAESLMPGGHVYIGELHPFKQYLGTKARFTSSEGTQVVTCHVHHTVDLIRAATLAGLRLVHLGEHFDGDGPTSPPRILSLLFGRDQRP